MRINLLIKKYNERYGCKDQPGENKYFSGKPFINSIITFADDMAFNRVDVPIRLWINSITHDRSGNEVGYLRQCANQVSMDVELFFSSSRAFSAFYAVAQKYSTRFVIKNEFFIGEFFINNWDCHTSIDVNHMQEEFIVKVTFNFINLHQIKPLQRS